MPEGPRGEVRGLQLFPEGVQVPVPQRVGGQMGQPALRGHLPRKDLNYSEKYVIYGILF